MSQKSVSQASSPNRAEDHKPSQQSYLCLGSLIWHSFCSSQGPPSFLTSVRSPGLSRGSESPEGRGKSGLVYNDCDDPNQDNGGPFPTDCNRAVRGRGSRVDQRSGPDLCGVLLLLPGRMPLHSRLLQPCTCQGGRIHANRSREADPRGAQSLWRMDGYPEPVTELAQSTARERARTGRHAAGADFPALAGFVSRHLLPSHPQGLGPSRPPDICGSRLTTTELH